MRARPGIGPGLMVLGAPSVLDNEPFIYFSFAFCRVTGRRCSPRTTLRRWGMTAKGRPIDAVGSWSVDSTPAWVRAAGAGQFLFRAVLEMGSGAGAGPVERPDALHRRRLPATQTEPINLTPAFVEGEADWLPPAWAGKQLVTCGWNAVTINPKGFEGSEVQVPLSRLAVTDAEPNTRWSRRRYATANWVLTLTEGANTVALTGPWLTLAWIGHLANWPEPPRNSA